MEVGDLLCDRDGLRNGLSGILVESALQKDLGVLADQGGPVRKKD